MLSTQVEYWKLQENKRHNVETEAQGWFNAKEAQRHNVETENVNWFSANEGQRHNLATEDINRFSALETQRHNIVSEGETQRHNVMTENLGFSNLAEDIRHNKASESINTINANAAMIRAQASAKDANTKYDQLRVYANDLDWQHMFSEERQELEERKADIAQQQADTQQRLVDQNTSQGWIGLSNTAYANVINQQRLEHQTEIDWANFGLSAAMGSSREARGWFNAITNQGQGD